MIARLKNRRQPAAAPEMVPAQPSVAGAAMPAQRGGDAVQATLDLEEAARAYTEVVQLLGALTRTAQNGGDVTGVPAISGALDSAWGRWDSAHRRLIGAQRGAGDGS